jgi:hypothetical protein
LIDGGGFVIQSLGLLTYPFEPTIKIPIRDYLCSTLPGLANFPDKWNRRAHAQRSAGPKPNRPNLTMTSAMGLLRRIPCTGAVDWALGAFREFFDSVKLKAIPRIAGGGNIRVRVAGQ